VTGRVARGPEPGEDSPQLAIGELHLDLPGRAATAPEREHLAAADAGPLEQANSGVRDGVCLKSGLSPDVGEHGVALRRRIAVSCQPERDAECKGGACQETFQYVVSRT